MENCCEERRVKVSLLADALLEGVSEVRKISGASSYPEVIVLLAVAAELRPSNLPTVALLSKLTSISPSTVQRILDKFVVSGLLEKKLTRHGNVYDFASSMLGRQVEVSFSRDVDGCIKEVVGKMGMTLTKVAQI